VTVILSQVQILRASLRHGNHGVNVQTAAAEKVLPCANVCDWTPRHQMPVQSQIWFRDEYVEQKIDVPEEASLEVCEAGVSCTIS